MDQHLPTAGPTTPVPVDICHRSQDSIQTATSLTEEAWTAGWTEEAWTGVGWTEWVPTPGPGVPREASQAQDGQEAEVDLDIIL